MKQEAWSIDRIRIGERCRKDMGDIDALAASIEECGLLQPVGVRPDGLLVCGERRLLALKQLNRSTIPVHVITEAEDILAFAKAEADENTQRKPFTPMEIYHKGKQLERLEEEAAKTRQHAAGSRGKEGGRGKKKENPSTKFVEGNRPRSGETASRVASVFGIGPDTYKKIKTVGKATEEATPKVKEEATKLAADMDAGKVSIDRAARTIQKRQQLEEKAQKAEANKTKPKKTSWEIRCGDCLAQLDLIETGSIDLIFADPPYNIGIDYGAGTKADLLPDEQYLDWCRAWIGRCTEKLTPTGSFWVLIGDEYAAEYALILKKEMRLTIRSWVKWYETFGVNCSNNFNRCSRHLFYCVKRPGECTFNTDAVRRPSDRQEKYNDKRADPEGKILDDVWEIPRLTGTAKERLPDFPTQLPIALLRLIVGCCSNPGDLVLDPFNGSGTTGAACIELRRRYLGLEKSKKYADLATLRLKGLSHEQQSD